MSTYKLYLLIYLIVPVLLKAQVSIVVESMAGRSLFVQGKVRNNNSDKTVSKVVWALTIRGGIEKPILKSLNLFAGISFDTKGTRLTMANSYMTNRSERDIYVYYLALPAGVTGKVPMAKKSNLFWGLNLYIARPLTGYEVGVSEDVTFGTSYISNKVHIQSKNSSPYQTHPTIISSFDYGVEGYVQMHVRKFRLGVRYSRGLKGVLGNDHFYDRQYYNSGIGITVGYKLW